MNDNSDDTVLLIQYLDGELTGGELDLVRQRINHDTALRDELEKLRLARASVKVYGLKQKVSSLHSEMMRELKNEQPSPNRKVFTLFKSVMYVAASVILIVGVISGYQYSQLSADNLYKGNYHVYVPGQSRGAGSESSVEDALKANQPDQAIKLFGSIQQPSVNDYFYVANSYLQKGEASDAIQSFLLLQKKNAENKSHFFVDDTEYYLAMAYLKNNQVDEAIALFEKINSDKNHLYHDKVDKWFLWNLRWLQKKQ